MASGGAGNSRTRKNKEFWRLREEAYERYGQAHLRPQEKYLEFLRCRRNILYHQTTLVHPKPEAVDAYRLTSSSPPNLNLPHEPNTPPIPISDSQSFHRMMEVLRPHNEFFIDLESHMETSLTAITACIQITAPETPEFIIYVPSVYNEIRSSLAPFLSQPENLVIGFALHGDINDLKQEFNCFPVAVFCIQRFLVNLKGLKDLPSLYTAVREICPGILPDRINEAYKKLLRLSDWTNWLYDKDMLYYAQCDVYYPKLMWEALKSKYSFEILHAYGVEPMKAILKETISGLHYPGTFEGDMRAFVKYKDLATSCIRDIYLNEPKLELLHALWDFRKHIVVSGDIKPELVLTFRDMCELVRKRPTTLEHARDILTTGKSRLETYGARLLTLLHTGRAYVNAMDRAYCKICNELGHIAKDCFRPQTPADKKRFRELHPLQHRKAMENKMWIWNNKHSSPARGPLPNLTAFVEETKKHNAYHNKPRNTTPLGWTNKPLKRWTPSTKADVALAAVEPDPSNIDDWEWVPGPITASSAVLPHADAPLSHVQSTSAATAIAPDDLHNVAFVGDPLVSMGSDNDIPLTSTAGELSEEPTALVDVEFETDESTLQVDFEAIRSNEDPEPNFGFLTRWRFSEFGSSRGFTRVAIANAGRGRASLHRFLRPSKKRPWEPAPNGQD